MKTIAFPLLVSDRLPVVLNRMVASLVSVRPSSEPSRLLALGWQELS